jgi:hypothetical protein
MELDKLTIGEAREIAKMFQAVAPSASDAHWELGGTYFIRTVTHHLTGVLVAVTQQELVIKDAAWIADDGRFADTIKSGEFAEVEPYPDGAVIIGRGALIDARRVTFAAPRSQR